MSIRLRLHSRLFIAFLGITVFAVTITGWQSYRQAQESVIDYSFKTLTVSREIKRRQIESYFEQLRNQAKVIVADTKTSEVARLVLTSRKPHSVPQNPTEMRSILAHSGFDRAFFVERNTGEILTSLADTPLTPSQEERDEIVSLTRSLRDNQAADGLFADFSLRRDGLATAFLGIPLEWDQRAILVFGFSSSDIDKIMIGERQWSKEGLGTSGETYLVGPDHLMRSTSRFIIEDSNRFFSQVTSMGNSTDVIEKMRKTQSTVKLLEVRSQAARQALSGTTGTLTINDYRNVPVLSSFRPLNIPGLHWVLLSEIDVDEALNPVGRLLTRIVIIGAFVCFASMLLGYGLAAAVARPIVALNSAVERLSRLDWHGRANVASNDEIGDLAKSFNTMATVLEDRDQRLQKEITQRRDLENRVIDISEKERQRLGQDLHDDLAQQLSATMLFTGSLWHDLAEKGYKEADRAERIAKLIEKTIGSVREIARRLAPIGMSQEGIALSLRAMARETQETFNVTCAFREEGRPTISDPVAAANLFRIAQEAVTNAVRHSKPRLVEVVLSQVDPSIILCINDDGTGFDIQNIEAETNGLGLRFMKARAELCGLDFSITSSVGHGTTVRCAWNGQKGTS